MLSTEKAYRVLRNMRRKELTVIVGIAMVLSTITGLVVTGTPEGGFAPDYITHAPILILNDANFSSQALAEGWPGTGTGSDPFIIENYDINGTGYLNCLAISGTSYHFEVRGCYLHGANSRGLLLDTVNNSVVRDNLVVGNGGSGIQIVSSSNCSIINNTVQANDIGIVSSVSNGNFIIDNQVSSNNQGIYVYTSSNVLVSGNGIYTNIEEGIYSICSDANVFVGNTISGNNMGLQIVESDDNFIYHNEFINNTYQAYNDGDTSPGGNNSWHSGYPSGGNHWSDYAGADLCSGPGQDIPGADGIGDAPYTDIEGATGVQDNYPLMNPWGSSESLTALALPAYQEVNVSADAFFDASLSTGNITNYTWDFGDRLYGNGITVDHYYSYSGYFLATLQVWDGSGNNASDTCIVRVLGPQDPYPIYGYVKGGDTGTGLSGCTVEVTYMDGSVGGWHTLTTVSSGTGQYMVDLNDYFYDSPVFCNVTANPVNGKLGTNSSTLDAIGSPGGRQVDVLCGDVPVCDLSIIQDDISFSDPNPAKWDEITINAEVRWNMPAEEPAVNLVKIVDKTQAPQGETLMYMIYVNNTGTGDGLNVWVNETYPTGVTFVNSNPLPTFGNNVWFIGNIAPGQDVWIFVNVTVNVGVGTGTVLTNNVTLEYWDSQGIKMPTEYRSADTWIVAPDTGLEKWGPATAQAGEMITYTILYSNNGTDWAYNTIITEEYPAGVTFVGAIPAPDIPGNIWLLPAIAPGGSGSIQVTVQVDLAASGTLTNHVIMDSEDSASNPSRRHAWWNTTVVPGPLLTLDKTAPAYVTQGEDITYTITCTNVGSSAAYYVWINETYPYGVTFVNAVPAPTFADFSWCIGILTPGSPITITITVQVGMNATGILENWVQAEYRDEFGMQMPTEYASATTVIIGALTGLEKFGPSTALAGETIQYTLIYSNNGTAWAYNIVLTEIYPAYTTFISAIPAPSVGNNVWNVGSLAPGSNANIQVTVQVGMGASGILTNHATMDAMNSTKRHAWWNTTIESNGTLMLAPGFTRSSALATEFGQDQTHPDSGETALCTVSFYLDNVAPGNLIHREYEVAVQYGGSANVSYAWTCNITGEHDIIVNVAETYPTDTNMSNNLASKGIAISEPCGRLKVKASSDQQRYILGEDSEAEIIVKVTHLGIPVGGADISCYVLDPNSAAISVQLTEASDGIFIGTYLFTNASATGIYRIFANASKDGYLPGENDGSKDKFCLDSIIPQMPELVSVDLSGHILPTPTSLTVTASVQNHESVQTISAVLSGHGRWGNFVRPMYDDGSHSDATAGDGVFTVEFNTTVMSGTYTLDISLNDMTSEKLDAVVISPLDYASIDSVTGLETTGALVVIPSLQTNVTIELNTVTDITDINFLLVEHRNSTGGKDLEFIPSGNAMTAMTFAHIEVRYAEEDIPANVSEDSLRLWLYNIYTERLEPCDPSGVDTLGDLIWGDTEHFSEFRMMSSPEGMSVHTIQLEQGWNLISIPVQQDDGAIERVLSPIAGLWDVAKYYDCTDAADPWKTYRIGSTVNDLFEIDHTMALWVHVSASTELPVFGVQGTSTQIMLHTGWNFVGYPTLATGRDVSDAFWGTGADRVEAMDQASPTLLTEVGSDFVLSPGMGLWVHVPADSVWTVP